MTLCLCCVGIRCRVGGSGGGVRSEWAGLWYCYHDCQVCVCGGWGGNVSLPPHLPPLLIFSSLFSPCLLSPFFPFFPSFLSSLLPPLSLLSFLPTFIPLSFSLCRYEEQLREQQNQLQKEDLSDMVAEHAAKQKVGEQNGSFLKAAEWENDISFLYHTQKRKRAAAATESGGKAAKKMKMKEFKFWNFVVLIYVSLLILLKILVLLVHPMKYYVLQYDVMWSDLHHHITSSLWVAWLHCAVKTLTIVCQVFFLVKGIFWDLHIPQERALRNPPIVNCDCSYLHDKSTLSDKH